MIFYADNSWYPRWYLGSKIHRQKTANNCRNALVAADVVQIADLMIFSIVVA